MAERIEHNICRLLLVAMLPIALMTGCEKKDDKGEVHPNPKHTNDAQPSTGSDDQQKQAQKLKQAAKDIVSNPSEWKNNASRITDFTDIAKTQGWGNEQAVTNFQETAGELISFWTKSVSENTKQNLENLQTNTKAASAKIEANFSGAGGKGSGDIKVLTEKSAKMVVETIQKDLGEKQQTEFHDHFMKALRAFGEICEFVATNKTSNPAK